MTTFNKWLSEKYGKSDHRYNDLLNDAQSDKGYPWQKGYDAQIKHLIGRNACVACLETLRDAYFDYLTDGE